MNLTDIQVMIADQAERRGWNTDLTWLELSVYKEVGELVQAIEHLDDPDPEKLTTVSDIRKEFGDIIWFLFQLMKKYPINLDHAIDITYKSNEANKKKTLGEDEKIVRK